MIESSDFRITRMQLSHGAGHMPFLGFGTLIPMFWKLRDHCRESQSTLSQRQLVINRRVTHR
jgi:hypothetical protein